MTLDLTGQFSSLSDFVFGNHQASPLASRRPTPLDPRHSTTVSFSRYSHTTMFLQICKDIKVYNYENRGNLSGDKGRK
jgi:hypothetical protein